MEGAISKYMCITRKVIFRICFVLCAFFITLQASAAPPITQTMTVGRFDKVYLYMPSEHPSHVAILVSGDGGWKLRVVGMAEKLSTLDTLVIGVDIHHYLKVLATSHDTCLNPSQEFEDLAHHVESKLGYDPYVKPLLVGYSSGATLVYASLVQAPPGTFVGAISLGFCPDLPLNKDMCQGSGLQWVPNTARKGVVFLPSNKLEVPWVALQGMTDLVCEASATESYVNQVRNGEVILLPKVGHGYAVKANWWPQFRSVFNRIYHQTQSAEQYSSM
ncbi:MAG: hypothetical protein C5B54_09235 [Acidobacteria bacterium]|nr:MAG: hypothetical protein C5B54_09235 [Acidobacteriota bacterium]